jgi:hypothetical protein
MTKISGMPRMKSAHRNNAFLTQPGYHHAMRARAIPTASATTPDATAMMTVSSSPPGSPVSSRPHSK